MAPQPPATAIAESRLSLLRGDPRAAQEKLLAARQLAGDRPAIQLLAGRVAMALGNHDIAIPALSRHLGGGVRDEDAALMLARSGERRVGKGWVRTWVLRWTAFH